MSSNCVTIFPSHPKLVNRQCFVNEKNRTWILDDITELGSEDSPTTNTITPCCFSQVIYKENAV